MSEILILKGKDGVQAGEKLRQFLDFHGFDVGEVDTDGDFALRHAGLTYVVQIRMHPHAIDRVVFHLFFRPRPELSVDTITEHIMALNRKYNIGSFWMDPEVEAIGITTFMTFRDVIHIEEIHAFMQWLSEALEQLAEELGNIVT